MTDPDLIAKKLAFIETCVRELRELGRPQLLSQDIKERRFVEHSLQVAIQAALDVAAHIVSDERLGEPATNRELFNSLERAGWLNAELATALEAAAGLRNIVVHGYGDVDLMILKDVVTNHLDDLLDFAVSIRKRMT